MDLLKYIDEAKEKLDGPIAGDILELQVNEEMAIECDCERQDNDITIEVDEEGYRILDELGLLVDHDEQIETLEQIQREVDTKMAPTGQRQTHQHANPSMHPTLFGSSNPIRFVCLDVSERNTLNTHFGH